MPPTPIAEFSSPVPAFADLQNIDRNDDRDDAQAAEDEAVDDVEQADPEQGPADGRQQLPQSCRACRLWLAVFLVCVRRDGLRPAGRQPQQDQRHDAEGQRVEDEGQSQVPQPEQDRRESRTDEERQVVEARPRAVGWPEL